MQRFHDVKLRTLTAAAAGILFTFSACTDSSPSADQQLQGAIDSAVRDGIEGGGAKDDAFSPEDLADSAEEAGADEQAAELGDGDVTLEEMRRGLDRFAACLEDVGFQLVDPVIDPFRGPPVFLYVVKPDDPAADHAPADDCNIRTVRFLEIAAQLSHEPRIEGGVRQRAAVCAAEAGIDIADEATSVDEFLLAAEGRGSEGQATVARCLIQAARLEHPDVNPDVFVL